MKAKLIATAGIKNAGKDTVINMINYINSVGTKASFEGWEASKSSSTGRLSLLKVNFADSLKSIIATMLNIPQDYLNSRTYKDHTYYCPKTGKFCNWADLDRFGFEYITLNDYEDIGFDNIINPNFTINGRKVAISLRNVMQYIGTDVFRNKIGENIWINAAKIKMINRLEAHGICYVSDVRFKNECEAIKEMGGVVILVERNTKNEFEHESEEINISPHYIINNDKSLASLFYKVLTLTYNI